MPALSFMSRFAPLVESGQKRQTIRKVRKRPIKVGDTLYLYTGMRTKKCRKLGEVVCSEVFGIEIDEYGCLWRDCKDHTDSLRVVYAPELGYIAHDDGFRSYEEMRAWFEKIHGLPFSGVLIRWDAPPSRESDR